MNNISIIVPSVTIHYIHDKAKTFDLHNFLTIDFQATNFYSNFNFIVHFIFHPFSSPLFSFLSLSIPFLKFLLFPFPSLYLLFPLHISSLLSPSCFSPSIIICHRYYLISYFLFPMLLLWYFLKIESWGGWNQRVTFNFWVIGNEFSPNLCSHI